MSNEFYIYQLRAENDDLPFYVGKGKGKRAIKSSQGGDGCTFKACYIKHLKENCISVVIDYVEKDISEKQAFELEEFLISFYGRRDIGTGILTNLTDGGEGVSGVRFKLTAEQRKKISDHFKNNGHPCSGKNLTSEHKRILSDANSGSNNPFYGKSHSDEHKKRVSENQKGDKNHNFGKVMSEETKKKLSESLRNQKRYDCPYCLGNFTAAPYKRFHGERCKKYVKV